MPNVASVLKSEFSRIARRELRAETASLKKAQASFRSDIASLKRATRALEQAMRNVAKHVRPDVPATAHRVEPDAASGKARFSAKGLASQRKRLGLSAESLGKLLGTSGQSVYNWESGKARPRDSHMAAIHALKTLGRKAAEAHLASMGSAR